MIDDFYDKLYDAWKSGCNPDCVSEERYNNLLAGGLSPDEISWMDCYPNGGCHVRLITRPTHK